MISIFLYDSWQHCIYLFIFCDGDIFFDSKWPINVQSILVKGQHEHNENKKSIENTEEENGLVSQFGQTFFDLCL